METNEPQDIIGDHFASPTEGLCPLTP